MSTDTSLKPSKPTHQSVSLIFILNGWISEGRAEVNGHSSRSSRRERRRHRDSDRATSQGSDREEEVTGRRSLKRKTARAAVNKIKLLKASDEDYEDEEEQKKPTRSSSRLRHTPRLSKRTAVIQSSSDSDGESSARGKKNMDTLFLHFVFWHITGQIIIQFYPFFHL